MVLENVNLRKFCYFLLLLSLILSILSALVFFIFQELWLSGYLSNLAAGIVGSLLVVFLIDQITKQNKEKEHIQMEKIAFQKLKSVVLRQMGLLCDVYKAACIKKPDQLPSRFSNVFNESYFEEITFLDFTKDSGVPSQDWFNRLDCQMSSFKAKLEQTINTYATHLDVSSIDLLEKIATSSLISYIPTILSLPASDKQYNIKRTYAMFNGSQEKVKQYTQLLQELIKKINSVSEEPLELNLTEKWKDDTTPAWGSGRV
ncbi:MAG: hypothetical protein GX638_02910 [Crenarchaeota archaeon]|nr:hypothetical protein [Thermoproteota archaeon]